MLKANVTLVKHSHTSDTCSSFLWLDRLGVGMALICGALFAYPATYRAFTNYCIYLLGGYGISFLDAYCGCTFNHLFVFHGLQKAPRHNFSFHSSSGDSSFV